MREFYEREFNQADVDLLTDPGEAEFEDCHFENIELANHTFRSFRFIDCTFKECRFNEIDLTNATFRDSKFKNCRLMGMIWTACKAVSNPSFVACKLDYSTFQGLNLKRTSFKDCSAKDTDFSSADLRESHFSGTLLLNASFNGADLSGANLIGASSYTIDPQLTKLKGAKVDFPEAVSLLTAMGIEVSFS